MKQHKASRKKGSPRSTPRKGVTRKAKAPKAARPKAAPRAKSRAAARERAPAIRATTPATPAGLVKLPAECLIGSLDGLRTQLVERLAIETAVSLDAGAVERIDTAGLQLLAAFTRDRRAAGRPVEWQSVPASLADAANLLNLTSVLELAA